MSDEHENCPHCGSKIDLCPHCKAYKPADDKFCQDCYDLWKAEREVEDKRNKERLEHIDDKYNYIDPYTRMHKRLFGESNGESDK